MTGQARGEGWVQGGEGWGLTKPQSLAVQCRVKGVGEGAGFYEGAVNLACA